MMNQQMMNQLLRISIRYALLALLSCAAHAQPAKLKLSYATSDTDKTYLFAVKPFADAVNKDPAAQSAVQIELFPNGALGRNLVQQSQMLIDGVADIAFVVPGITPGRFPDNGVLEMPGLFRDLREATLVYTRLTAAGKLNGYQDYFVIGALATAPFSVHMRAPISGLNDLKGKKVRAGNATEGAILKSLGAVPVLIPVTEIAEAVGRGTIDGATAQPETLIQFGISRVTGSHYFIRFGVAPLAVLMNRKKFESLPKAGQDAIRKYSGEALVPGYIQGLDAYYKEVMAQLAADPKRKVIMPSQAELEAAQSAFKVVYDEWLAKSPRNATLLKDAEAEIAKIRAGR